MKQIARDWLLSWLVVFTIGAIYVIGWSYARHVMTPAIEYGQTNEFRPSTASAGQFVHLCRDLTFARDVKVELAMAYTSLAGDGREIAVSADHIRVDRKAGQLHQCRWLQIPQLPAGEWDLHTYVSYTDWPFWTHQVEAPPVRIRVIE